MADLTEQLSALLSDPAGMEKIRAMASGLLSQNAVPEPELQNSPQTADVPDISKIMSIANSFKNQPEDSRIRLLYALKPHLSPEKQARVDKAAKILRLLSIAPMLSQMGLFEF